MLEKLGEVLRKATDKITNAIFLDKNLVDQIVRDLQRALIEADVNIILVKQITDKIKKAAMDERIKGVEKKEHLIKLLHDELIGILGEYKQLKLKEGQNKIMFLGLYGAGKCVHENAKIQLNSGEIIKAKDIYGRYSNFPKENLKDGESINIEEENLLVPSYNPQTQKIENKKATNLWKLKKQNLIEVCIEDGNDNTIKVTPEHPFFTLKNGKVVQIRADQLTEEDYISIPSKVEIDGKTVNLFKDIKKLNLDAYLNPEEIINHLPKNKNLKEICRNLKNKRNYCHLTKTLKQGKIPLELIESSKENFIKLKDSKGSKIISFPLFLTKDFAEFLGYVIGDGYLAKGYIGIANEDKEIIQRVIELSKILFNITPTITRDKRTKKLVQIRLNSTSLVELFSIFNLKPGKKGKSLEIPRQVMLSENETIRTFIKAYFDCDSCPAKNKRTIELISESQIMVQQINMLLKRFGILSTISKKEINEIPYWRLIIKARYAEIYSNKIGYLIKRKKNIIMKYPDIGIIQGSGNQDMIPLGILLKALRMQLGFSIGEIQKNIISSYGIYEKKGIISREHLKKLVSYYKIKKKGFIWNILKDIEKQINLEDKYFCNTLNGAKYYLKKEDFIKETNGQLQLTQKSKQVLELINETQAVSKHILSSLENIADSNICWIPIKKINRIKNNSSFVYDLTIEDNHSFIAEGIIVHNTTTTAKIGNYFAKRGNKVAIVGLDVHRPAAKEQLMQLGKRNNLNIFVDMDENDAIKTWKKFKPKLKDYDVVLIDTAGRHNLDKELIKEIKSLGKAVKPTETILVMPADIGQAAKEQAQDFKEALNITGVIITRMDSTAKAGGALTACAETDAGVYFIATGEKINDLEEFNPENFLSRLLGMGDLGTLVEKIRSITGEANQEEMQKKIQEGKISLEDVIEQVKSMSQLGGFGKIKSMIPGMGQAKIPEKALESQEAKIAKWEHILKSMTKQERDNPELFDKQPSRITRVANGAGVNKSNIKSLLKQYKMLSEMIKEQANFDPSKPMDMKKMQKLMKKFGKVKKMKFK